MQGVVIDDNGAYVKAAIVMLIRETDSADEPEKIAVTYDETDEKGRFLIQDLNPDDKYIIEIYVERPEAVPVMAELEMTAIKGEFLTVPELVEEEEEAEPEPELVEEEEEAEPEPVEFEEETDQEIELGPANIETEKKDDEANPSMSGNSRYDMSALKYKPYMTKVNTW